MRRFNIGSLIGGRLLRVDPCQHPAPAVRFRGLSMDAEAAQRVLACGLRCQRDSQQLIPLPLTPRTHVLKSDLCNSRERASTMADPNRKDVRRRQVLKIIFAIVLVSIAGTASAQSPQTDCQQDNALAIQYDGVSATPIQGGAVATKRLRGDARPAYVELAASLSNFDADADPDGWRADIILRDRKDRPVVVRANATFELMPRIPTHVDSRYVDADTKPVRWSMPLEFDDDAVARIKLPLRQSLRPMLGWTLVVDPPSGTRSRNFGHNRYGPSRGRPFVTTDLRNLIGTPSTGELRVRVSVPTEGVFEAATPVRIRPSILVDTRWPYR